jgi:fatty acid desaturase
MNSNTDQKILNLLFPNKALLATYKTNKYYSVIAILVFYCFIFISFFAIFYSHNLSIFPQILINIFSFFIIGYCQYSIGNGMHEAVHRNLPIKSDLYNAIFCAYPIGLSMGYRETHLRHHRFVGTPEDPDFEYYQNFPRSRLQLIGRFFKYFSGIPAVLQFISMHTKKVDRKTKKVGGGELAPFLLVQTLIFTVITYIFNSPYYYFFYWVLPVASVGKLLSSTRLMCEHGSSEGCVIRTITGSRFRTWSLGAFDFNYHAEHHLVPSIPFAHLKNLYQLKQKNGDLAAIKNIDSRMRNVYFDGGYFDLLKEIFLALPWCISKRTTINE